jgi:hypothetical protein
LQSKCRVTKPLRDVLEHLRHIGGFFRDRLLSLLLRGNLSGAVFLELSE